MNQKIHFIYILSILIVVIIILSTVNFGSNQKIVEYFTFALTVSSLLLALIAIIFSFISNSTVSKNMYSITESARKISTETDRLHNSTQLIINKFDSIPTILAGVDKKVEDSLNIIQDMQNAQGVSNVVINEMKTISNTPLSENGIKTMLLKLSLSYLDFLYAITLSFKHKIPFDRTDHLDFTKNSDEYTFGGEIIFQALDLYQVKKNDRNIWNILDVNQYVVDNIEDAIYEQSKILDEERKKVFGNESNFDEDYWSNKTKAIENKYK